MREDVQVVRGAVAAGRLPFLYGGEGFGIGEFGRLRGIGGQCRKDADAAQEANRVETERFGTYWTMATCGVEVQLGVDSLLAKEPPDFC